MPQPGRLTNALLLLGPALATLAVYSTGLGNGFVWIDHSEVLGRTKIVESWPELWETFAVARNGAGYHRPVYDLLFTLDHLIWGDDPFGFHLSSALLHALNTLLLTLLLRRVTGLGPGLAAAGGLLFGLHPLHSAVGGLVHAKADLFGVTCGISTVLAVHAASRSDARRFAWSVAAVTACTLGLLTKELLFLLPPMVAAWAWLRPGPEPRGARGLSLALLGSALAVGLLHLRATRGIEPPEPAFGLVDRLATFQTVYLDGLLLFVWPEHLRMADTVTLFAALPTWQRIATTLGCAASLATWVAIARRWPRLAPWILLFHLALLPVSQVVPILHFRADRYFYVPGLAVAGTLAVAAELALRSARPDARQWLGRVFLGLLLATGLAFTARITRRLPQFHDDQTLFGNELQHTPDYLEGATHLARALEREGRWPEAERLYLLCLADHPGRLSYCDRDAVAVNLLNNLIVQGRDREAWEFAQRARTAVRSPAHRGEVLFNGGIAAFNARRPEEAVAWLSEYRTTRNDYDSIADFLIGEAAHEIGAREIAHDALLRYLDADDADPARKRAARALLERL